MVWQAWRGAACAAASALVISCFGFSDRVKSVRLDWADNEYLFAGDTARVFALASALRGFLREETKYDSHDMASRFDWQSSDLAVATVDANGLVTARGAGKTVVTAVIEGVRSYPTSISVTLPATSLIVQAATLRPMVGDTVVLAVTAIDARGSSVAGVPFFVNTSEQDWTVLGQVTFSLPHTPFQLRYLARTPGVVTLSPESVNRRLDRRLPSSPLSVEVVPR